MPLYDLTEVAQQDMRDILVFIARENPDAALKLGREFISAMERLAVFPHLGQLRKDFTNNPFRFWPMYSYFIMYRPDTKPLEIVRVLSGYRNIADLLS